MAGIPRNSISARAAHNLLGRASANEKIALTRILADLFDRDNTTGYNAEISLDLRQLAGNTDREVARAAASALARLGYLPGSEQVLADARASGIMDDREYYGELAHLSLTAPRVVQLDLFKELRDSKAQYASEVLAYMLNADLNNIESIGPDAKAVLSDFFKHTEPEFPSAVAEFGYTDLIRYNNWIRAATRLRVSPGQTDIEPLLIQRLAMPSTDPRAVLSYLLSKEGATRTEFTPHGDPARALVIVAMRYAEQFPAQPMLNELKPMLEQRLSSR